MTKRLRVALVFALSLVGCQGQPESNAPLLIHCAASLSRAMEEATREFAERSGSPRAQINSASSLLLWKQIEADAPGDVFVAAAPVHMDLLADAGRIDTGTRIELLRNRMALLVSVKSGIKSLDELASPDVWVALASEGVPAGDYARELLGAAGLWEAVSSSILSFPHEPAVFQAIQRQLVPAAFVYTSSLHGLDDELLREIGIAADLQPAINYPAAVLKKSRQPRQARRFLDFLRSSDGQAIFERHGFIPLIRT
jgi:molybdate transport system substrate-binding protein